ncbi:MAG: TIGR03960 family B12-binding radical SAM protein [Chloroflexi bacterium]|nr:TIGR03960 family B12-binding radical SAM protein [Chloroflexota bacterium]
MTDLDSILYRVSKPARYTGGEWNSIIKDWGKTPIRIVLAYPDLYEIGMSNMALPILYELLNNQPDVLAERVFAPWVDMAAALREANIPLFSLESKHPLKDFDVIGFSLGYELTYTNVLNMLSLAQIPVRAEERDDSHPLVMAGGSGALNPEVMADFFDLFVVGDAEDVLLELLSTLRDWKQTKAGKQEFLHQVAAIPGIYVPSLYQVEYHPDGQVKSITPTVLEASPRIQRRIVSKLPPPVTKPVVPYIEVVHDRAAVEIQRGCTHGCRFCQAGAIYRPLRERPQQEVLQAAGDLIANCGYDELSLVSLSTSDYPKIDELVARLCNHHPDLAISLPSLYINTFSIELMDSLPTQKKTGLTFAPEAGSERLRRSINKNISEEELLKTAASAFERGWTGIKLYFMVGLPGETMEDVQGIIDLVEKVRSLGKRAKGRTPQIRVNVSTFVPKPHTPFQWVAQESEEGLNPKHELLKQGLRRGVKLSWHDPKTSLLEAALSRGDRRLSKVIQRAWELGCVFDSWEEQFNYEKWARAFQEAGLDPAFYARRQRSLEEVFPWSHIDVGVSTAFLKREYQRSLESNVTRDCRYDACNACGLERVQPACQERLQGTPSRLVKGGDSHHPVVTIEPH